VVRFQLTIEDFWVRDEGEIRVTVKEELGVATTKGAGRFKIEALENLMMDGKEGAHSQNRYQHLQQEATSQLKVLHNPTPVIPQRSFPPSHFRGRLITIPLIE
jgi:hypothetical protein